MAGTDGIIVPVAVGRDILAAAPVPAILPQLLARFPQLLALLPSVAAIAPLAGVTQIVPLLTHLFPVTPDLTARLRLRGCGKGDGSHEAQQDKLTHR